MTAEQEATIEKFRKLLSERWGIRRAQIVADPDGYSFGEVIGGREDHDDCSGGFPPVVKRSQHVFPGKLHMREVVERIKGLEA